MKKTISSFLLLMFAFALCAQNTAEVHILRKTGFTGSAVPINLIMDSELLCKVNNKKYSIHEVEAGEHLFQARLLGKKMKKKNKDPLKLVFEAGETYYLQLNLQTRVFDSQVDVQEITKSSAVRLKPDLKEEKNCKA